MFSSIFGSMVGAIVGLFLAIGWDLYKSKKEEKIFSRLIKEQLLSNKKVVLQNLSSIELELENVLNEKALINPLVTLQTSFFDLIHLKINSASQNPALIEGVRKNFFLANEVNETIRSRETYRNQNRAMNNFYAAIKEFDQILLIQNNKVNESLDRIIDLFNAHIS